MRTRESRAPLECQFVNSELMKMEAISLALFLLLFVIELFFNPFQAVVQRIHSCNFNLVVSIATRAAVSRSIAKPGVNINHILLRLNDRENAEK